MADKALHLTHLDKLYWKKEKITKGDLIRYYETMAPYILPYLKNRPLVLRRYPEGIEGEDFFQKNIGVAVPDFVETARIQHEAKKLSYVVVQNKKSLLYVVNLGSIELHPFHTSLKHLSRPDYMVLDLDPEDLPFKAVIEVAQGIHEMLEEARAPHFCKTSGGRGLHIYIPLQARYEEKQVASFAKRLAEVIHEKMPGITSLERSPKKRQKKVYIDYLQNRKYQTIVCAYSVRGRPYAPVSAPLLWKEVKEGLDPLAFTLKTMPRRMARTGDLFKDILRKGVHLPTCLRKLEIS